MKYTVQKLDGRFTYRDWFQYYIGFSGRMSRDQGPLQFTQAQEWFFRTYGWSAEVRNYADMWQWTAMQNKFFSPSATQSQTIRSKLPDCCNPHWSWTNGYDDLRIYVAGDKELAFFKLAHPVDQ